MVDRSLNWCHQCRCLWWSQVLDLSLTGVYVRSLYIQDFLKVFPVHVHPISSFNPRLFSLSIAGLSTDPVMLYSPLLSQHPLALLLQTSSNRSLLFSISSVSFVSNTWPLLLTSRKQESRSLLVLSCILLFVLHSFSLNFPITMWWSGLASAPLTARVSISESLYLPLMFTWSIWFRSFREVHVIVRMSLYLNRAPPITKSFLLQNVASLSSTSLVGAYTWIALSFL